MPSNVVPAQVRRVAIEANNGPAVVDSSEVVAAFMHGNGLSLVLRGRDERLFLPCTAEAGRKAIEELMEDPFEQFRLMERAR